MHLPGRVARLVDPGKSEDAAPVQVGRHDARLLRQLPGGRSGHALAGFHFTAVTVEVAGPKAAQLAAEEDTAAGAAPRCCDGRA